MENKPIMRDLNSSQDSLPVSKFIIFLVAVIVVGILSGFIFSKTKKTTQTQENVKTEKMAGIADKKTFKDKAEGILKEGGADGEGSFHLERPGGASQNVYLTSSTVDLSQYQGKKVRVWGETFSAQKAGWLMDVGLVELLQ